MASRITHRSPPSSGAGTRHGKAGGGEGGEKAIAVCGVEHSRLLVVRPIVRIVMHVTVHKPPTWPLSRLPACDETNGLWPKLCGVGAGYEYGSWWLVALVPESGLTRFALFTLMPLFPHQTDTLTNIYTFDTRATLSHQTDTLY